MSPRWRRRGGIGEAPGDRLDVRSMAEGVHLQEGRHLRVVREVVPVLALEVRCRFALGRDEPDLLALDRVREEGEGEAAEVRSASEARDHEVWVLADVLELPLRLKADDSLVQEDVVQDGAEAVDRLLVAAGVLEALRD